MAACDAPVRRPYHSAESPAADTLFIQPFYPASAQWAAHEAAELRAFYHVPVVVLPSVRIYDTARSSTGRYSADRLLQCLSTARRAAGHKILGLTTYDIFTRKNSIAEWGIFGLGRCPGDQCIVSDFRLRRFKGKTQEFVTNVVLHEIGHNYGLPHCGYDSKCLMNDAKGTIATLYREQKWLCPHCSQKLTQSLYLSEAMQMALYEK